ncbi:hypothetical protein SAMN05216480_103166 [Pustulibacterium marinum]|uniref:Uncharacterized protein n=1 Tax=Pustulibacterium marinum TaxID=1224947 RepID=A0A1I7G4G7_9FLAO|nr:hypothetical protein SAMN05216480_103166 [Pustulibacterium marinum]
MGSNTIEKQQNNIGQNLNLKVPLRPINQERIQLKCLKNYGL